MARQAKIFTIYHVLDKKGVFESNPANAGAVDIDGKSLYKGPVEFPKMLYHPKGERELVQHGSPITTREGEPVRDPKTGETKRTGDVWGTKHKVVHNTEEEQKWLAEGWLSTEAAALRNNVEMVSVAPPKTLLEQQAEELAALKAKLASYEATAAAVHHPKVASR